jgi:hypothetical protein
MKKSGLADSPFFIYPQGDTTISKPEVPGEDNIESVISPTPKNNAKQKPETVIPRHHDTTIPRYHDTIIELVRRGVKDFGKEAATHRFTMAEKKAITDIIYTYKSRGIRTSENEITRVAVNFLVEDFRENGEASVLDKTLKALNG